jgi:hypothetical protein
MRPGAAYIGVEGRRDLIHDRNEHAAAALRGS